MNLLLYGKNAPTLTPLVSELGFKVVQENPEVIISYGGDGTILAAEHELPGVPKLALRDSLVCVKCADHEDRTVLQALRAGKLQLVAHQKLGASHNNQQIVALNDIVLRNQKPMHALRFYVQLNDQKIPQELVIGDGIIASTAFGSTGYFHSVTRQMFHTGFAIGFSNSVAAIPPLYFSQADTITVTIVRGLAELSYDNTNEVYNLTEHDVLQITPANQFAHIYNTGTLRCTACVVKREARLIETH